MTFGEIVTARAQKHLLWASVQTSDTVIQFEDPNFLKEKDILSITSTMHFLGHCTRAEMATFFFRSEIWITFFSMASILCKRMKISNFGQYASSAKFDAIVRPLLSYGNVSPSCFGAGSFMVRVYLWHLGVLAPMPPCPRTCLSRI